MNETDADEPVAPLTRRRKTPFTDRALTSLGLLLAGASALFPWYVFLNQDKFGIHVAEGDRSRDLPDWPARNVFSVSPLAMVNKKDPQTKPELPDPLTTATISDIGRDEPKGEAAEAQPLPGKSAFRLLHVANGRALIEDPSGMYVVRVGSVLPDNSRLAALEQRDGKWVIVTSSGEVYQHD